MAGIGVTLNKIFSKNTITTHVVGSVYSLSITVAPMVMVIGTVLLMGLVLHLPQASYARQELFSSLTLYMFVFSLLAMAPTNAVLSRYLADMIYEEKYGDILPCFYIGLFINLMLSCILGVPFCVWAYQQGQIEIPYICCGYLGYMALVIVFYGMLFLSASKDYRKTALCFGIGMGTALGLSVLLVHSFGFEITLSMLISLVFGFCMVAALEFAIIKSYFRENSNTYKRVLIYFGQFWKLILTQTLYTLGLYVHNFIFWTSDLHVKVAGAFYSAPSYDMATFLGMATNITTSVIFLTRVEMHFHPMYKGFSEAIIGGRGMDIESAKKRMFGQLSAELMNLVRIQFIISVVVYLLCAILLPGRGFSGLVMQIYPSLAAGYFILFIMYSAIIFLYYFNDMTGSVLTAGAFLAATLAGSIFAETLPQMWYGLGVIIGAGIGWGVAYSRLRWVEKNIDRHIFCQGILIPMGKGKMPSREVLKH
jgi:uncharacterized membrane protein